MSHYNVHSSIGKTSPEGITEIGDFFSIAFTLSYALFKFRGPGSHRRALDLWLKGCMFKPGIGKSIMNYVHFHIFWSMCRPCLLDKTQIWGPESFSSKEKKLYVYQTNLSTSHSRHSYKELIPQSLWYLIESKMCFYVKCLLCVLITKTNTPVDR